MPAELLPGFTKNTLERFSQEKVILPLHFVTIKSPMKAFTAHKATRIVYNCGYFLLCGISVVKFSLPYTVCHRLQRTAALPAEGWERWAPQLRQGDNRQ